MMIHLPTWCPTSCQFTQFSVDYVNTTTGITMNDIFLLLPIIYIRFSPVFPNQVLATYIIMTLCNDIMTDEEWYTFSVTLTTLYTEMNLNTLFHPANRNTAQWSKYQCTIMIAVHSWNEYFINDYANLPVSLINDIKMLNHAQIMVNLLYRNTIPHLKLFHCFIIYITISFMTNGFPPTPTFRLQLLEANTMLLCGCGIIIAWWCEGQKTKNFGFGT